MPLPGSEVKIVASPPNPSPPTDSGVAFIAGKAPTPAVFERVYSLDQFVAAAGARDPSSPMYDSVDNYFREGGGSAYISTAPLAGVDADIETALAKFTPDLGPGQVLAPGLTSPAVQAALMAQADPNGRAPRVALIDLPDIGVAATLATDAEALTGQLGDGMSAAFAPWDVIPGVVPGTPRTVPPSARIAGNIARNDAAGYSPNAPAAGRMGQAVRTYALSQPAWSDADRQALNEAGVNVSRVIYNNVRTYGWRSLASQTTNAEWSWFNNSRLLMVIKNDFYIIAENFEFNEEDGRQLLTQRFAGSLTGALMPYFISGSLYGATPQEAFSVDTGPAVNTDTTMSNGELHAKVGLRFSKFAETVYIDVARVPITEALAA